MSKLSPFVEAEFNLYNEARQALDARTADGILEHTRSLAAAAFKFMELEIYPEISDMHRLVEDVLTAHTQNLQPQGEEPKNDNTATLEWRKQRIPGILLLFDIVKPSIAQD